MNPLSGILLAALTFPGIPVRAGEAPYFAVTRIPVSDGEVVPEKWVESISQNTWHDQNYCCACHLSWDPDDPDCNTCYCDSVADKMAYVHRNLRREVREGAVARTSHRYWYGGANCPGLGMPPPTTLEVAINEAIQHFTVDLTHLSDPTKRYAAIYCAELVYTYAITAAGSSHALPATPGDAITPRIHSTTGVVYRVLRPNRVQELRFDYTHAWPEASCWELRGTPIARPQFLAEWEILEQYILVLEQTRPACPIGPASTLLLPGGEIPAPGMPLPMNLAYNPEASDPGRRWTHDHDWALTDEITTARGEDQWWKYLRRGADRVPFQRIGENLYAGPPGGTASLQVEPDGGYTARLAQGETVRFDPRGVVQHIEDTSGNRIAYTHRYAAARDRFVPTRAEHSNGAWLDFRYAPHGRLKRIDTPSTNLYFTLNHDPVGQPTAFTRWSSGISNGYRMVYRSGETNGLASEVIDPDGRRQRFAYAPDGSNGARVVSSGFVDKDLLRTDIRHLDDAFDTRVLTQFQEGGTRTTTTTFHPILRGLEAVVGPVADSAERPPREERFQIDGYGNVTNLVVTDWDTRGSHTTRMQYNDRHQVTNLAFGFKHDAPSDAWSYRWHPDYETLTEIIDPTGRRIQIDYTNALVSAVRQVVSSNEAYLTRYEYSPNGLLLAVTNASGHAVRTAYDARGYPRRIERGTGPAIEFDHNELGRLERLRLPGPDGPRVVELEPDGLGRVRRVRYPNRLEEAFGYDGVGNLLAFTDTAGRVTTYRYGPLGALESMSRRLVSPGATQDVVTAVVYDQQRNVVEIRDPLGRSVESYRLDVQDRAAAVTNVEGQVLSVDYIVDDYVRSVIRFDGTQVWYDYDAGGRLNTLIVPGDQIGLTYAANGLLRTATNQTMSMSNAYDSVNRLTQTVARCVAAGFVWTNRYAYAPAGRRTHHVVTAGATSWAATYVYDAAERLRVLDADASGAFSYTYNPWNGRPETLRYPNGVVCRYRYDLMDRLSNLTYNVNGVRVEELAYEYDRAGRITQRIRRSALQDRESRYQYDSLDRLTGEMVWSETNLLLDATYEYDLAGNRRRTVRNGVVADYRLGEGNRLAGWTAEDSARLIPSVRVAGDASEPIGTDSRFGTREVNGWPVRVDGTNFVVDALPLDAGAHRLVAAVSDPAGNVGYATNAVTIGIYTNAAFTYDAAGNMTTIAYHDRERVATLDWDGRYQLHSVFVNGDEAASYGYDPFGRRVATTEGNHTAYHIYDGLHCVADIDETGAVLRRYTYGPGIDHPLALTIHGDSATNTYYYLTDAFGSVLALTDRDGAVVESYTYDAWGRVDCWNAAGVPLSESALGNRLTFQAREICWSTALHYHRARWYTPYTARWLSKDPIGIAGGLNQYVAFRNNPASNRDPFGLYEYSTESLPIAFLHEMNPFNRHGSLNNQFSAAWALLMGDPESASELSGIGQLRTAGAGRGWEEAYWFSAGVGTAGAFGAIGANLFNAGAQSVLWHGGARNAVNCSGRIQLEFTRGGRALTGIEDLLRRDLPRQVWKAASGVYAANATGKVPVFVPNASDLWKLNGVIWMELKVVQALGNAKTWIIPVP